MSEINNAENRTKKINRRKALKKLSWLGILPLALLGSEMTENFGRRVSTKTFTFKLSSLRDVNFFDDLIIIRGENSYRVFSSKCTHLGCKIRQKDSSGLLCSCHGSKFSFEGDVMKGPATDSLTEYPFQISDDQIKIYIGAK